MSNRKGRKPFSVRSKDEDYTDEERTLIVQYIRNLRIPQIKSILRDEEQKISGNKDELISTIKRALDDKEVSYSELVRHLDRTAPWSAQHVVMFGKPTIDLSSYMSRSSFELHLRAHHASKPFRAPLPLALPEELTISSIDHDDKRIRITAIERRYGLERDKSYDRSSESRDGERIDLRAFVERTTRGLIVFDWDLLANEAMLQITQLPSDWSYESAQERFSNAIHRWLPLSSFPKLNLAQAISTLHEAEEQKTAPLHSHGMEYARSGARVSGTSASEDDSVLSDAIVSNAFRQLRTNGTARKGNVYWHLQPFNNSNKTVHVVIWATKECIIFPTDNEETVVRHVLTSIRNACG